jgi:hypothetical protein
MNYSGQTICNSMENLIQHKYIVKKEAIPQEQDYIDALTDIQRAGTIVVNAFNENNPDQPIPEPITNVQNVPLPPEVMASFQVTGQLTQAILGSFVSNQNKDNQNLSGKAVIESASADNAAAMPYVVGYLAGLNQIGNICADLMPKYLIGKRVIPVENKAGDKGYQEINSPGKTMIAYDEKAIKVNIDAGVNFQVQKTVAMQQILGLMQASEEFSAFMNSSAGLPILLDNIQCYGADRLKEASKEWMQQQQQQQQQAMQMQQQQQQMDPAFIRAQAEMMKVQQQKEQDQVENQIAIAKMSIEKELADAKILEAESKISQSQIDSAVRLEESQTSLEVHSLEAATKMAEIQSRRHDQSMNEHHAMLATHKLHHEINQASKEKKE